MKEYRVVASIYNDLLTLAVVRKPWVKERGFSTSIHSLKCNSLEEIPDIFLGVYGDKCDGMKDRVYWYVDAGDGWVLTNL